MLTVSVVSIHFQLILVLRINHQKTRHNMHRMTLEHCSLQLPIIFW